MKDLENKLQFVITLTLFFPVLMSALFEINTANEIILKWGRVVIFLILNYLYLNLLKPELTSKIIKWIDLLLDLNIFLFIPLILSFSVQTKSTLFTQITLLTGLWGVMLVPIFILLLLISYAVYRTFPKFFYRIIS